MKKLVWQFILTILLVGGCTIPGVDVLPVNPLSASGTIAPNITLTSTIPAPADIQVYFSDTSLGPKGQYDHGPDGPLATAIRSARVSVDMAIYNINLWSIRDALLDAYHRGVQVRLVMESDNLDDDVSQELKLAGISILGDRREGLMHNKFVVIDEQDVWTGSMNFTIGSAYYDSNNLVHIHSKDVAEDYTQEFDEMFVDDMFGQDVVSQTPHPQVLVGQTIVEVYFSPDDKVEDAIIKLIHSARQDIHFMAFSMTLDSLGAELISKSQSGLQVEGIMDDGQVNSNTGSEYDQLVSFGVKVTRRGFGVLMHHKVIIIDREIVITGSYNFSSSAEKRNDENVIIIHDAVIASQFLAEYQRLMAQGTP